jgi:WD40 repeat protein
VKPLLGILSILALGCSAHQTSQQQAGKTGEPESSILRVEAVTVSARGEGVSLPVVSGPGEEGVIITHDDIASAVAISRDGRSIASAGLRGTVALCQVQSPSSSPVLVAGGGRVISFSIDGRHLYVAAGSTVGAEGYTSACIAILSETGDVGTLKLRSSASIEFIHQNPDSTLTIVTADNRIGRYRAEDLSPIATADVFGGFLGSISASPGGEYVAVSSQNEIDRTSAEPCKLTIFDSKCTPVFTYEYGSQDIFLRARHAFSPDGALYVVAGQLFMRFAAEGDEQDWTCRSLPPVKLNSPSTIAVAGSPARVWVADQTRVAEIDPGTSRIIREYGFAIGDARDGYCPVGPITDVAVNLETDLLAVACHDGTVRIRPLREHAPRRRKARRVLGTNGSFHPATVEAIAWYEK